MSTSRRIYFGSYFEEFSPRNSGVEEPGPSLVVLLKGQLSHMCVWPGGRGSTY